MKHTELTHLIEQWLDNEISDSDLSKLKSELLCNTDALSHYVDLAQIHSLLHQAEALPQTNVIPIERVLHRQKRRILHLSTIAAAAIILLSFAAMTFYIIQSPDTSLAFRTSPGSQFHITHTESTDKGPTDSIMRKGSRLTLSQGSVELNFSSGVKSIIIAPADITLKGGNELHLEEGTAWFHVPEGAEGFQVTTHDLTVIDLGTQFGISSHPASSDQVHVFEGEVIVKTGSTSRTLIGNQAVINSAHGVLDNTTSSSALFLTELPQQLPHVRWSFDSDMQATGTHPEAQKIHTIALATPKTVGGKIGSALELVSQGQHLVTDWSGFSGNRPRTIACWIRIPKSADNTQLSGIIGWGSRSGGNNKWKMLVAPSPHHSSTVLRLSWGHHWVNGTSELADGEWHHLVATTTGKIDKDGRLNIQLYVDGTKEQITYHSELSDQNQHSLDTSVSDLSSVPLLIGSSLSNDLTSRKHFKGVIDELIIFDGHMTESDVSQLISPEH